MKHVDQNPGERGMVLVVVLWMVATIALLVSAFNASVNSGVRVIGNELWSVRAQSVLDAGVELAAFHILQRSEAKRWAADGRAYRQTVAGTKIMIRIFDASGKIDLNRTPPALLKNFLRRNLHDIRQLEPLMSAILEVRKTQLQTGNEHEAASHAARGGDSATEASLSAGFQHISQLLRLRGMSITLYRQLAPFVTVYNHAGIINPAVASREVLLSLADVAVIDVERLLKARADETDYATAVQAFSEGIAMVSKGRPGPAYTIVATLGKGGARSNPETRVTILTGPQQRAPFHVLSWESSVR